MEQDSLRPLTGSQQRAMSRAVDSYALDVTDALGWLEARGITVESAATYRLGVVREPIPGHERYEGMLCIPYLDAHGNVTQVRFRCLQDHNCKEERHGKYESTPGSDLRLWNIKAFTTSDDVLHVAEGEFDAMILQQLGFNAVGCPGATTWRSRHTVGAKGFNAVYIWGDGDKAGRDQFNASLYQALPNSRIVPVPDGHDITSMFLEGGEEAVLKPYGQAVALYGAN